MHQRKSKNNFTRSSVILWVNRHATSLRICVFFFRNILNISILLQEPNQYYYSVVFFVIFLPLLIVFLWLNTILAKEIFSRRRPIPTSLHAPAITVNDDQSVEKRTSETNTVISDGPLKDGGTCRNIYISKIM